jgi:hypothetical protein
MSKRKKKSRLLAGNENNRIWNGAVNEFDEARGFCG